MPRFVVLESDIETKGQKVRVMRDGFAVFAIAFPLPWLLFHRLWFEAALILPFIMAISIFSNHPETVGIVFIGNLALGLIVALEGDGRVIARMKRNGYREIGAIAEAHNQDEAELYAAGILDQIQRFGPKRNKKPDTDLDNSDMILGLA